MSRINTNVSSLIAQRVLRKNNNSLNTSLERLSTGLKINKGADNPAGLIASENLRLEKSGIAQAIDNAFKPFMGSREFFQRFFKFFAHTIVHRTAAACNFRPVVGIDHEVGVGH